MSKRTYSYCLAVCLVAVLTFAGIGCLAPLEEGPPLPSLATMQADFALFATAHQALSPGKADELEGNPKANFNNAALRVGLLNAWIAAAVSGPAFVWGTAMLADPVWENGKWTWDFEASWDQHKYASVLSAWFENNRKEGVWLDLEMEVTCTACKVPTDQYLWYTGTFNTDGNEGTWEFFNPQIALENQTFVTVDYKIDDPTHKELTFTNTRLDGHEDSGDVITYKLAGDIAHVSVHDESKGIDYTAEWSVTTTAGWLQVPDYNGGEKACWDAQRINMDCPAR